MSLWYYGLVGLPCALGVVIALAEIVAPEMVIQLRRRLTRNDQGHKAALRDWFDDWLETGDGGDPSVAHRRVRWFGLGLLTVMFAEGYVFLVLIPARG
jgi:hypothetical protein